MPPRGRNAKRGSCVAANKKKRKLEFEELFLEKDCNPHLPLNELASQAQLDYTTVKRRWKRYKQAKEKGDKERMRAATENRSGGHNRTFTTQQEKELAEYIRATNKVITYDIIQENALSLKQALSPHPHQLRDQPLPFTASSSFVDRFKKEHRLSSHRTKLQRPPGARSRPPPDPKVVDAECFDYVTEVRAAIEEYGKHMVLNMDETPVELSEPPTTAIVPTGSKQPAYIPTDSADRSYLTTFPCVSAAGDKLPLCAILKGKTCRVFNKIRKNANSTINKVKLYHTMKEKMNEITMLQWIRDVVLPYTRGAPSALILDRYTSHHTRDVTDLASLHHIQLILVPAGQTSKLQPLDVNINGPMLASRKRIWKEKKRAQPDASDSWQAAVERAQLAYQAIATHTIRQAFSKAYLI